MRFHPFSCGRMVKGGMHCTKNSSSVSGSGDIYTQDAEKGAKEEKVDVRKFLPPSWQKDVVVDEDAGVAMRMLDDKVQPL